MKSYYVVACDLFQFGHTPLHSACIVGHPQVVQMLLDGGADINAQTKVYIACTVCCPVVDGYLITSYAFKC